MKRYHLLILCAVLVFAAATCLVGCQGEEVQTLRINAQSDYGNVVVDEFAVCGDKVTFTASANEGYVVDKVYVNGETIVGSDFVMPCCDVKLLVTYAANGGYTITCNNDGTDGVTVASLTKANKGDTVTLYSFVGYNKKAASYTVNGQSLAGNKFTMPAGDVEIATTYTNAIEPTNLVFTVSQSGTNAVSYWHARYTETGLALSVDVEDALVYSVTSLQRDIAYIDNIEFVLGFADTNGINWGAGNYKVIVASNGEFRFEKYDNGWKSGGAGVSCKVTEKKLFKDGYAGYNVEMTIPYGAIGTSANAARDKVTLAVAMRNAVNGINSTWASCGVNGCLWNSPQTHFLVTNDGIVLDNKPDSADYLFVGNGLFDTTNWTSFASSVDKLGDCVSVAKDGASIKHWIDNIGEVGSISANNVYFCGGAEDIAEVGVLQAFGRVTEFTAALRDKLPQAKLTFVSQIPLTSVRTDNAAIAAFNGMVADYAASINADYIDVCSDLYGQGEVYRSLYAGVGRLSDDGYRLLGKRILVLSGKYAEKDGNWGDNGLFVSTCDWDETAGTVGLNVGGIQETFLRGKAATDFEYTAEMTTYGIYNGDSWPKMGLTVHGSERNMYFYIDATSSLDSLVVGLVQKSGNDYLWTSVSTGTMAAGTTYTKGNYVTMTVRKTGNTLCCKINGSTVIETDVDCGSSPCVVGLFCFNMQVNVRSWTFTDLSAK